MIRSENYTDNKSSFIRWMKNITEPVTQDLRSAIWKKRDGDELSRAEVHEYFLDYVPLTGPGYSKHMEEREQENLAKVLLPWSERPAWAAWGPEKVAGYYNDRQWTGKLSTLADDIKSFRKKFPVRAEPLPIRKAWHRLPGSTSSGLPWLQSQWKEKIGADLASQVQEDWKRDSPQKISPSMPMWRTDPYKKVRLAWAESKTEALYGAPFVYPVADRLRDVPQSPFIAWKGPDDTAAAIRQHLRSGDCDEYLSVDYSSYDQTQSPELVRTVWNDLIHPMTGSRKPNISSAWLENFTSGPLVTPEGLKTGAHGVPSGSVATNFVDSINNALCIEGYLSNYGIEDSRYWVQGDDALICGKGTDPKDFAEFAQSEYGFIAHPDKQYFGIREGDFLQNSYYVENEYLPTYPAARVAWRMIGHERFSYSPGDWNKWAVVVRAIQQLNNAYHHPYIDDLVRWAGNGDNLRLGACYPPRDVMRMAGKAGYRMVTERARWDLGAEDRNWDVLPVQRVIREEFQEEAVEEREETRET
jgi:hypothetical protein